MSQISAWRRATAVVMAVALVVQDWSAALAQATDPFAAAIVTGAALGQALVPTNPQSLGTADDQGNVTLWPGSTAPMEIRAQDLFRGTASQMDGVKDLYGQENNMADQAAAQAQILRADPSSPTGAAYDATLNTRSLSRPNMSVDPIWTQTDQIFANWDTVAAEFGDCKKTSNSFFSTIKSHQPAYKNCTRATVAAGTSTDTFVHEYQVGIVEHLAGPANVAYCGPNCIYLWIGTVGNGYWNGQCQIYEEAMSIKVINPDAVVSAKLEYAKWDDHIQILLNNSKLYNGPTPYFPPEEYGTTQCELSTHWERNPEVDVTSHFKQTGDLNFKLRVSVTNRGEGYARIRVDFDPAKIVYQDQWPAAVTGMADGFCKATAANCTQQPALDGEGCATINGARICPNQMLPSPIAGISPFCERMTVTQSCEFWNGAMGCWTDTSGVQHCPVIDTDQTTDCTKYEADPSCGFTTSACVQGARGASGTCYLLEEKWDCGYDVDVAVPQTTTDYSCNGAIRCMGTECGAPTGQQSDDFTKVVAAAQAAQYTATDTQCVPVSDTSQNVTCAVFAGDAKTCKKAVGGLQNCCEGAPVVDLADYITLAMAVGKTDTAMAALGSSTAVSSAWNELSAGADEVYEAVAQPFTAAWEGVTGTTEAVANGAQLGVIEAVEQEIMTTVAEWGADVFGPEAMNEIFHIGGQGAFTSGGELVSTGTIELGGMIGTALSWIMIAYTIYQVVMILIQIIWACEQKEFELQIAKQLRSCHFVGTYCASQAVGACVEQRESHCCFSSPLSRILQEQVRPQLSLSWGSPKNPDCRGLTPDEMSRVDWNQVDLGEWLGILAETGNMPTDLTFTPEGLTGAGTQFDYDGTRQDVITRTKGRLDQIDVNAIYGDAEQELRGP
ncbi:MAG: conjugal transfer mating pair stabilization protein TraN [Alphaproteobacteria bacterium]|nr:conjugal transfer mating pair stabilization protein TraN [Alphaproteobacteria bacterium]